MTQKDYMRHQIEEIEKHKWIESEKAGVDLGECAVCDWIKKYSKKFRDTFNNEFERGSSCIGNVTTGEKY